MRNLIVAAVAAATLVAPSAGTAQTTLRDSLEATVPSLCIRARMAPGVASFARTLRVTYDSAAVDLFATMARVDRMPPDVIRDALCGRVRVGWHHSLAWLAWGDPDSKTRTTTPRGTGEVWTYADGRLLIVLRDTVYSITETERR